MKKVILLFALLVLLFPAFSQDAGIITQILEKETASYMDFSYLVASEIGMDSSLVEAYIYCDRFGSFPFTHKMEDPITVKTISHFLMKNYGLKGGIMWALSHSPRYAWKELKAYGFWKQGTDPSMSLSGRDVIRLMSQFIDRWPDAKLQNPPVPEAEIRFRNAILQTRGEAQ